MAIGQCDRQLFQDIFYQITMVENETTVGTRHWASIVVENEVLATGNVCVLQFTITIHNLFTTRLICTCTFRGYTCAWSGHNK